MKIACAGFFAVWMGISVSVANAAFEAKAWVGRDQIAIGDTVSFHIEVSYSPGARMKPLALGDALGEFIIRDIRESRGKVGEREISKSFDVLLTIFSLGKHTIPEVPIIFVDHGKTFTVSTQPIDIEVKSILPDNASEIRDIKGPLSVAKRWRDILLSYALLIGLIAGSAASILFSMKHRSRVQRLIEALLKPLRVLIAFVSRILRLRRAHGPQELGFEISVNEPNLTPHEAALKELERIEALNLIERGMIKEHYSLVSETIRRYLERKYGILAMEQPTSHTLEEMGECEISDAAYSKIEALLRESDLVKFAKYIPPEDVSSGLISRAREIVEITTEAVGVSQGVGDGLG